MFCETFSVKTSARSQAVDVTPQVNELVGRSGVDEGMCEVFVPHTTAGICINEGADPAVMEDVLGALERLVPWDGAYAHLEGNAAAHIKSVLVGSSVRVPVERGRLRLGTWQSVFFMEFDGPRTRRVEVRVWSP